MNVVTRGIRNAFRNGIRTFSIIVILGLSIGLAMAMVIARGAVQQKISSIKSSVGTTITIQPGGYSSFSEVNNALTSSEVSKVSSLAHVTSVAEELTDRLTTNGASSLPSFGNRGGSTTSNGNNTTSLTSPVKLNVNGNTASGGGGGGAHLFISGGGQLPTNFSLPITILGTNDPSSVSNANVTITSGSMIDGSSSSDVAMVSKSMASKNNLKVGSTFTAYGTTLTVKGIFTSTTQGAANTVVVPLATEQTLSAQTGDITDAVATVDSVDNLSSVTTAIKNTLGSSADVTNSQDQVNQEIQPLNSVKSISLYSLIGAVCAGAAIILMTMVMIVRERRREIGVLKAVGASNLKVMFQFMAEAVTFTLSGAVVGVIFGVIAGNPITRVLVSNSSTTTTATTTQGFAGGRGGFGGGFGRGAGSVARSIGFGGQNFRDIHATVGWSILAYGLGAAILIAIIGSAVAALLIAKVRPAEVMRAE